MRLLQTAGRAVLAAVAVGVLAVVALQFARAIHQNVQLVGELSTLRRDVADFRKHETAQERTIRRLREPAGAIPEIHEKLRLTRSDEAIIYLRGGEPTAQPQP